MRLHNWTRMSELIGYSVVVLLCDSQQTAAANFHFHLLSQVFLCLLHGLCLAQFKHYTLRNFKSQHLKRMQRGLFLEIAGFVYWLYAVIDFSTVKGVLIRESVIAVKEQLDKKG